MIDYDRIMYCMIYDIHMIYIYIDDTSCSQWCMNLGRQLRLHHRSRHCEATCVVSQRVVLVSVRFSTADDQV